MSVEASIYFHFMLPYDHVIHNKLRQLGICDLGESSCFWDSTIKAYCYVFSIKYVKRIEEIIGHKIIIEPLDVDLVNNQHGGKTELTEFRKHIKENK